MIEQSINLSINQPFNFYLYSSISNSKVSQSTFHIHFVFKCIDPYCVNPKINRQTETKTGKQMYSEKVEMQVDRQTDRRGAKTPRYTPEQLRQTEQISLNLNKSPNYLLWPTLFNLNALSTRSESFAKTHTGVELKSHP